MNSRNKKQHIEVMDRLSSIKYAMNNPSVEGIQVLQKAVQFLKKQYEPKSLSDSKTVPQIDLAYINGFITSLSFNVADFGKKLEEIDNPKTYVRQLEFGAPIKVIKDIMSAPRISTDELSESEKKRWTALLNTKMDLTSISDLLGKITPKQIKAAQISARVLALVILVIGTILTNYILFVIAAGLVAVDISIDKYLEESIKLEQQGSILDTKKTPYFISGVYPLIHVNREKEHKEVTFNQNSAFEANNLLELITKIHAYIDFLDIQNQRSRPEENRFPLEHLEAMIRTMWSRCGTTIDNTTWVRDTKDKILSISRMCCTENFIMEPEGQVGFLKVFLYRIESVCRELAGTRDNITNDMAPVELVPMYETLFLQIWDAFLTQNRIKKTIPQVNQYVSIDLADDTPDIMLYYNSLQPLDYGRKVPDANDIISNIFESVGAKVPTHFLTEAASNQDPAKVIDEKTSVCIKNLRWHKEKRDGAKGVREVIKWEIKNTSKVEEIVKYMQSLTIEQFSMNPANVASALVLLNSIQVYLTTDYFKNRPNAPNNINDLIMKAFPGAGITDANKAFPGDQLANIIGSGNRNNIPNKEMTGNELQKFTASVIAYFANPKVSEYWNSDIYEKLEKTISSFKTNATNANRQPVLKESVESDSSILSMFEADPSSSTAPSPGVPPTIENPKTPDSPSKTPAPGANVGGDPKNPTPVVTNQSATKDAEVLTHAVDIVGKVLNIVYKMTALTHFAIWKGWSELNGSSSGNPQQGQAGDANPSQL